MNVTLDEALQKAIQAHKAGQRQEADRLYTAVLKAQPKNPDANHNKGLLGVSIGKLQEALPFFKTALEANPNISQFWLSYIDTLIKLDRLAEAKGAMKQAKDKGAKGEAFDQLEQRLTVPHEMPTEADMHNDGLSQSSPNVLDRLKLDQAIRLAKKKSKGGAAEDAKRIYDDVLAKFPNNKRAIDGIRSLSGQLIDKSSNVQNPTQDQLQPLINLFSQGQLQQVLDQIKQLLQQFPNSIILHNMCGVASNEIGQYDDAIESFYKALKIQPDFAEAYNGIGNAQREKGDLETAIDSFKQAITIKPDFTDAYNNMGNALKDKGDLKASIDCYEQALKIKPDYAEAYYNMGNALQDEGDIEAAIGSFKQALKIKPDFPEAYNNMGAALRNNGDLEAAIKCYDKLNNQEAIAQALECTYILGSYNKFNERLETIVKKDPSNIRVAAISAFAAHQIKQKDPYPFCKNPLELIKFNNIKNHVPNPDRFIHSILDEMNRGKTTWAPKSHTTKGGFRTSGNLFSSPSSNMKILEGIIKKELNSFYSKYNANKSTLIGNWPDEIKIAAWYVRLLQSGYQNSHIHPAGWVSGVFYLKTVEAPTQQEGAIEFGLRGYDYPVNNEDHPRLLYQPSNGDLVLFPSSLFHRTIPVIKDVERCVIAFDLIR